MKVGFIEATEDKVTSLYDTVYLVNRDSLSFLPTLTHMRTCTGPRYVVQIGDKVIDYNEDFRLFMATRNPTPFIPPDAISVVTEVNFTTTRAGLRGQVTYVTHTHKHNLL